MHGSEINIYPIVCSYCGKELGNCGCGRKDYVLNREFTGNQATAEQILRSFAEKFRVFSQEIELQAFGDTRSKLLQMRCELITQLPSALRTATDFDTLDQNLITQVQGFGQLAQDAIGEHGGIFQQGTVLSEKGSRGGGPNMLETLIISSYGANKNSNAGRVPGLLGRFRK